MWLRNLVLLAIVVWGQTSTVRAEEAIPQDLVPLIESASKVGEQLYSKDRAAIVATDQLAAQGYLQSDKRLRGWITEETDDGFDVIFFGKQDGTYIGVQRVLMKRDYSIEAVVVSVPTSGFELTEEQRQWIKARQFALSLDRQQCTPNVNTVVLSDVSEEGQPVIYVYRFSANTKQGVFQLGGHDRVSIAADDMSLLEIKKFTNSCIALDAPPNAAALFVTELLSPVPTEIHVFVSLQAGVDLLVMTSQNGYVWKVSGSEIGRLK